MTLLLPAVTSGAPLLDTVHHTDALTLLRALPTGSVDAVITDPPYGVGKAVWDDSIDVDIFRECLRVSRGYSLFFYANTRLHHILGIIQSCGYDAWVMVWHKPNSMQISRKFLPHWSPIICAYKSGQVNFWGKDVVHDAIVPQGFDHPTVKPLKVVKWLIEKASKPGALICDPFMGSGTTAIAARLLGRRFIGCDISAEYVNLAKARLAEPYTLPLPLAIEPVVARQEALAW